MAIAALLTAWARHRAPAFCVVLATGLALLAQGAEPARAQGVQTSDITFPAAGPGSRVVRGKLSMPAAATPAPAVVLLHGSAGIDGRGAYHATALHAAGIATLEIQMFSSGGRPASLRDTLPHALGALNYLAERGDIDPARIGAMGFSWGGGLSILLGSTSFGLQSHKPGRRFAANVGFYPTCYVFTPLAARPYTLTIMTPLLVLAGEKDDYDRPDTCPKFREGLGTAYAERVTVHVFPGATHKWDGPGSESFYDGNANLGRGGQVTVRADPQVAQQSRQMSVDFFRKAFAPAN